MTVHLDVVTAVRSDDPVKQELELTCDRCGRHLCDIEEGDSLSILVAVATDHIEKCGGRS